MQQQLVAIVLKPYFSSDGTQVAQLNPLLLDTKFFVSALLVWSEKGLTKLLSKHNRILIASSSGSF